MSENEDWDKKMKLVEDFQFIRSKIYNEGLGYYILSYTDSSSMPDDKSKELFEIAEKAMNEFQNYIEENAKDEDF